MAYQAFEGGQLRLPGGVQGLGRGPAHWPGRSGTREGEGSARLGWKFSVGAWGNSCGVAVAFPEEAAAGGARPAGRPSRREIQSSPPSPAEWPPPGFRGCGFPVSLPSQRAGSGSWTEVDRSKFCLYKSLKDWQTLVKCFRALLCGRYYFIANGTVPRGAAARAEDSPAAGRWRLFSRQPVTHPSRGRTWAHRSILSPLPGSAAFAPSSAFPTRPRPRATTSRSWACPLTPARPTSRAAASARRPSGRPPPSSSPTTRCWTWTSSSAWRAWTWGTWTSCPAIWRSPSRRSRRAWDAVVGTGAAPLVMGGDHSITLPELRAVVRRHGPVALLHFDAHSDTGNDFFGKPYNHGTTFHWAMEEGLLLPEQSTQIGIRGPLYARTSLDYARAKGLKVISGWDLHHMGLDAAIAIMRGRVRPGTPVFVSFDIDFLDAAYAPRHRHPGDRRVHHPRGAQAGARDLHGPEPGGHGSGGGPAGVRPRGDHLLRRGRDHARLRLLPGLQQEAGPGAGGIGPRARRRGRAGGRKGPGPGLPGRPSRRGGLLLAGRASPPAGFPV